MYYLGLDIGSSSIKVALVEASGGKSVLVVHEPKKEMSMTALKSDWAEKILKFGGPMFVLALSV